jgi:hypothetical protein
MPSYVTVRTRHPNFRTERFPSSVSRRPRTGPHGHRKPPLNQPKTQPFFTTHVSKAINSLNKPHNILTTKITPHTSLYRHHIPHPTTTTKPELHQTTPVKTLK